MTGSLFEPREDRKGDVARAMMYFYVIYGNRSIQQSWFEPQIETMLEWHEADPADAQEVQRTRRIQEVQGNVNPFVLDPTLMRRIRGNL